MIKYETAEKIKNLFLSITLVIMLCLVAWILARPQMLKLKAGVEGKPLEQYYLAGINNDGIFYAVGVDDDGYEVLRYASGSYKRTNRLVSYGIPEAFRPADMVVSENGSLFIGGRNTELNELYCIHKGGTTAEKLLSLHSDNAYSADFSHITEDDAGLGFLVEQSDGVHAYVYDSVNTSLNEINIYSVEQAPIAIMASGTVYVDLNQDPENKLSGDNVVEVGFTDSGDEDAASLDAEEGKDSRAEMWSSEGGVWMLDRSSADLWFSNSRGSIGLIENLKGGPDGSIMSLTLSDAGMTSVTDKGTVYIKNSPTNTVTLTKYCCSNRAFYIAVFVIIAVLLIAFIPVMYTLLEIYRRRSHSFIPVNGGIAITIIIIAIMAADIAWISPNTDKKASEWVYKALESMCTADEQHYADTDSEQMSPGDAYSGKNWVTGTAGSISLLHFVSQEDGSLALRTSSGNLVNIAVAKRPGEYIDAVMNAFENGTATAEYYFNGRKKVVFAKKTGEGVTTIACLNESMDIINDSVGYHTRVLVLTNILVTAAAVFAALLIVRNRIVKLSDECDAFASGRMVKINADDADEIGALALKIENATVAQQQKEAEMKHVRENYRRFLPDELAKLTGADSVRNLSSGQCTIREMIFMQGIFNLKDDELATGSDAVFSRINEFICRINDYMSEFGGIAVNYSFTGFTAVFPVQSAENAIKTAVAIKQDVNLINAGNTNTGNAGTGKANARGGNAVEILIGLDVVPIVIGAVGNEKRMQIVSGRRAFTDRSSVLRRLHQIKGCIICSGKIIKPGMKFMTRNIGFTESKDGVTYLYEVYESDPNEIQIAKTQTLDVFDRGVAAMQSRDYAEAKRCFMEVLMVNFSDDVARFYLEQAESLLSEQKDAEAAGK